MISRRSVLSGATALAACAAAPIRPADRAAFFGPDRPLGLQLYQVIEDLNAQFDATLARIAAIGYRRVELVFTITKPAKEIRAALDRAGLACTSGHYLAKPIPGLAGRTLDGDLGGLIDDARTIGMRTIVMALFPLPDRLGSAASGEDAKAFFERAARTMTAADWEGVADELNRKGEVLARAGLRLAYHNHDVDLAPLGDASGLDILLRNTDPARVGFEMDVAWVVAAGRDHLALLASHPDRFRLLHVKDLARLSSTGDGGAAETVPVGDGIIDWPAILPAAARAGVEEYFVEQEPPYKPSPLEAAERGFRYLATVRS